MPSKLCARTNRVHFCSVFYFSVLFDWNSELELLKVGKIFLKALHWKNKKMFDTPMKTQWKKKKKKYDLENSNWHRFIENNAKLLFTELSLRFQFVRPDVRTHKHSVNCFHSRISVKCLGLISVSISNYLCKRIYLLWI